MLSVMWSVAPPPDHWKLVRFWVTFAVMTAGHHRLCLRLNSMIRYSILYERVPVLGPTTLSLSVKQHELGPGLPQVWCHNLDPDIVVLYAATSGVTYRYGFRGDQ